jgi:hypothetical protein
MSKHTPGPWLIAGENKTFIYALGPMDTNVFWCDVQAAGKEMAEKPELEANARLIAQTPRLLEALAPFAALLQSHNDTNEHGNPVPDNQPVFAINGAAITIGDLRKARSAIAAATEGDSNA